MTGGQRVFPDEEFAARREKLCAAMAAAALDGLVVSTPENIFYLPVSIIRASSRCIC